MQLSIIIKAESKKNVLSELEKLPCIFSIDNSLMYKNELMIDLVFDYNNKVKVSTEVFKIEKKHTPISYL